MSGLPTVPQIRFNPQASLSTLEFWWQAPVNNGGALIQNYTLLCSSIPYSTIIGPSSFYAKVAPLVNAQDYTFQLAASNTNGLGPYIAFTTAQPGIRPAGISGLAVSQVNVSTANVTWNFTQNAQESGNHYFVMTVIPSTQTAQLSTFQVPIYPNQRSQQVTNLSSMNYTFLVQSVNDANYSFPNTSSLNYIGPSLTFSPSIISNLNLWLDGADPYGTGVLLSTNLTLTTWKDKSSNAVTPTVSGGGGTGLTFAGSTIGVNYTGASYLNFPNGTLPYGNSPFTYFLVFNPASNGNNYIVSVGNSNASPTQLGLQLRGSDMDFFQGDILTQVPTVGQTAFVELIYYSTFAQRQITLNTYSTSIQTNAPVYNLPQTYNYVGANSGGGNIFSGKYNEFITYNRTLGPYERQVIEGYLAWKWNFTSYLSAAHPFKNAAPNSGSISTPPSFTPGLLPSLHVWLDGNDPLNNGSTPGNGTGLARWYDKSGCGHTYNCGSSPTVTTGALNGLATISFTTSQSATFGTIYGFNNVTLFTVAYKNSSSDGGIFGNNGNNRYGYYFTTKAIYDFRDNGGGNPTNNSIAQSAAWDIQMVQYSNTGTLVTQNQNWNGTFIRTTTNVVSQLYPQFICNINTYQASACQVAEMLIFGSYLNTNQVQVIEGYLAWKWGLQGNLPGGHPFASAAPTGTTSVA